MDSNHIHRSFRVPIEPDGSLDADKIAALLRDAQNSEGESAEEFADALREVPRDSDFEPIGADIPWLPDYLERVYGWSRKGPRP